MGTYRLLLAFAVLYSHVFGGVWGVNIGVIAVIGFFVMSGYVMTLLLQRYYMSPLDLPAFYLDRALRIFPQYLFYLIVTLITFSLIGYETSYIRSTEAWDIVSNITIIPLGYYMFAPTMSLYVPPAWSLGLELSFYLIVPFFLMASTRYKVLVAVASLAIAGLAFYGIIDTDYWGYRLLPGTFFIFASGILLASKNPKTPYVLSALVLLSLVAIYIAFTSEVRPYNREVWLGVALSIPVVAALRSFRFRSIDELLGNLSYGVFLNHFLVLWVCTEYEIALAWVPLGSLVLAAISYYACEYPAMVQRRRIRERRISALGRVALASPPTNPPVQQLP